jgi:DNA-binding Lrp family transcriptional regulator
VSIGLSAAVAGRGLTRLATILVKSPCVLMSLKKGLNTVPNNPESLDYLDHIDRLILNALQDNFPLDPRPYALLAERINESHNLSLTEDEALRRVKSLKERKYVRRIGAIFNNNLLGYQSTLCAAKVPVDKVEMFAKLVNSSQRVTHNYLRNDELNIWFTFCYKQKEQLKDFFNYLKTESGIDNIYEMPSKKVYKIRAVFNL